MDRKTFDEKVSAAAGKHLAFMRHPNAYFERNIFIAGASYAYDLLSGEIESVKKHYAELWDKAKANRETIDRLADTTLDRAVKYSTVVDEFCKLREELAQIKQDYGTCSAERDTLQAKVQQLEKEKEEFKQALHRVVEK